MAFSFGAWFLIDPDWVDRRARQGDATVLYSSRALAEAGRRSLGWRVVLDEVLPPATREGADRSLEAATDFLARQDGLRPFVLGVLPEAGDLAQVQAAVAHLASAALRLPAYRRTTLVVLGDRQEEDLRWCLVIPMGGWSPRAQPGLGAVLDGTW